MERYLHRLVINLSFPAGLCPGEGKDGGNRILVARDGQGRCVLRGSALAGALRHAWERTHRRQGARWFGEAIDDRPDESTTSPLRVADIVLSIGNEGPQRRKHNSVDRHSGSVRDGGFFEIEALPPGTSGACVLLLEHNGDPSEAREFLEELAGIVQDGLTLGGGSARGIGRATIRGVPSYHLHDVASLDGLAEWLDESWLLRGDRPDLTTLPTQSFRPRSAMHEVLRVTLRLRLARGQDVCVGGDELGDYSLEPQRVRNANGEVLWRLPGSTLRGLFRAWITRLAARDGEPVADSVTVRQQSGPVGGDEVGWGFTNREKRELMQSALEGDPNAVQTVVDCPVMRLFGSLFSAGRIHIADAYLPVQDVEPPLTRPKVGGGRSADWEMRRHVSVDRFTGGASEGFLFDHIALRSQSEWEVVMTVRTPSEQEARWLARTLRAVDMGLLRIGSSKSSGRFELATAPSAEGLHADVFRSIQPMGQM